MTAREFKIHYTALPTAKLSASDRELEVAALAVAEQGAYAPYSGFRVGAALRLASGRVVTGSNQENAAYPSGLCAERTALFYAASTYPDDAPTDLLIVAINAEGRVPVISPCGGCRQVIMETAVRYGAFRMLLSGRDETVILEDCRSLLPFGFDGSEL